MANLTEIPAALAASGWQLSTDKQSIHKVFKFADFRDAMSFMVRVSYEAEAADHHPEWLNVYNRVETTLTTHDTGGLTQKDIDLAEAMDKISER
ncbi:4a-hydroxytetrahydrobiopterin dehydratase [Bacterioplanes sanyensis]|uniref:Putative pterin-4-alpha-carbinolamine dehydratase n=1 Tax=Bacterioplanes sanyensis TaxID=1249553 RepID=A0A222FIX9_9GAMM|nr:4a-hydroxytetrahydrobiopterin dehydratase [Bacterioplanes sanyensis]ASP38995.1 4a-hydroxytetrahydrobiopterin dehydratase [Bacterioplanes sanyensis]